MFAIFELNVDKSNLSGLLVVAVTLIIAAIINNIESVSNLVAKLFKKKRATRNSTNVEQTSKAKRIIRFLIIGAWSISFVHAVYFIATTVPFNPKPGDLYEMVTFNAFYISCQTSIIFATLCYMAFRK
jgi:hypothetical protein